MNRISSLSLLINENFCEFENHLMVRLWIYFFADRAFGLLGWENEKLRLL
jgi:hypothetical protein